jgi:Fe-S-cluster-containing dehydrogenase component
MKGFLLDLNRCTGCHACRLACSIENGLGEGKSWRKIFTFNPQRIPDVPGFHLSLACQHCAEPACMTGCPALAYSKDSATGAVLLNGDLCIGCRYCGWACPFDAPSYDPARGTVSKCTLCHQRLVNGETPACTSLCPTGALQFGELDAPRLVASVPGFAATALKPSMKFVPLRTRRPAPELSSIPRLDRASAANAASTLDSHTKISFVSEWSLIVFTLAATVLVAVASAAAAGSLRLEAFDFALAALGTLGISSLHLGKRGRAWRALLNLRRSWLSREVFSYIVFVVLALGMLLVPDSSELGWLAAVAGYGTLFCIDQVYGNVSFDRRARLHSAGTLLTGLFLFGMLTHDALIAGGAGLAKLVLYSFRKDWPGGNWRPFSTTLRLCLGFVTPLACWNIDSAWTLAAVLAAEWIDRCEFYRDLDIPAPQRRMGLDLRAILAQR